MSLLAFWVHDLSPFLIRFGDNFGIRYYGLAYLLGFVAAGFLFLRYHRAGKTPLEPETATDLVVAIVAGVILGGRIGYFVFYQPEILLHNPIALFKVWEGGMASHGAFIGVTVALWLFTRGRKVSFLHIGDLVVSTAPVGLFLGRVANFINGELWGKPSRVPWAVIFPHSAEPGMPAHLILPRHPSQLYEAATEGLLLFAFAQWRLWKTDVVQREPGRLAGEFLIAYALVRMFCELFREPDAALIMGLSRGTFYSVFLIAAGLVLIAFTRRPKISVG
ncbi:MAG: prolipoprotein diacylglyceryl transferase [Candidatus Didemnitutus sp.]|nr:prolipoprotein diacylglyceryl transferase [Candidatus Didemnitutus sp.]